MAGRIGIRNIDVTPEKVKHYTPLKNTFFTAATTDEGLAVINVFTREVMLFLS